MSGIARSRHQLATMLHEAYANREALEDQIAQGRRNRKEAGNKYGIVGPLDILSLATDWLRQVFRQLQHTRTVIVTICIISSNECGLQVTIVIQTHKAIDVRYAYDGTI